MVIFIEKMVKICRTYCVIRANIGILADKHYICAEYLFRYAEYMIRKTDASTFESYLRDASNYSGHCDAVYLPESVNEIAALLQDAQNMGTMVTVSGNGTGLTGGRVPEGGAVLALDKLNVVISIGAESNSVTVEPGLLLADLIAALLKQGKFYPPDPTEKNCFIGATIATNASGARTYGFGATRQFVEALELVLPDGELLRLRRGELFANGLFLQLRAVSGKVYTVELPDIAMPAVKNAAGYYIKPDMDAIDLFIGSEGTLGVITKATLRVLPLPEKLLSAVIFFQTEDSAFAFCEALKKIKTDSRTGTPATLPRSIEFFDGNSLRFISEKYPRIPSEAKGAVWIEQDYTAGQEDELLKQWQDLIAVHSGMEEALWFAFDEADLAEILEFRHAISYLVNEYITRNGFRKLGTDAAVPDESFAEFYRFCKETVTASGLPYVLYGHFGNSHPHLNMLPRDEKEFETGKQLYLEICKKAVALCGTVSAEHGIGKFKRDYLRLMYTEQAIKGMAAIKKVFDPNLILNRGNIFYESDFL